MKNGKSCGPDGIPTEARKHLGDWGVRQLTKIFNAIMQSRKMPVFGIMSCHLMLAIRLKQRTWNWSSPRMCRRYGVHASHPYSSVGSTTAQYTLILVTSRTPRSLQSRLVSLPNDPLALPILADISSSIDAFCDIVMPK